MKSAATPFRSTTAFLLVVTFALLFVRPGVAREEKPARLGTVDAAPAAITGQCPFDPADLDTSLVRIQFRDKAMLLPWKIDYDTGHHPAGFPLQLKAFFYASAGEKDIETVGDLEATWPAANAIPGTTADVTVRFDGDANRSEWTTAFGVKGGLRYKLDVDVGKLSFEKSDYVPGLPAIRRRGFGCIHEAFSPPAFDAPAEVCGSSVWAGDLDCFLTVPPSTPVNCAASDEFDFELDWEVYFGKPDAPDTTGSPEGSVCSPAFWPHPTTEMYFCLRPGLCVTFDYDGKSLTEESSGATTNSDAGTLTVPVEIPCDFAQARDGADGPQIFHFTLGPFRMEADWVLTFWTKAEPVVRTHFVKALELTFQLGKAICARIAPNPILDTRAPLSFNKPDATFQMTIVEPDVCDIVPGESDFVTASELSTVAWKTTWGAPDACGCRAKLDYRQRYPGTTTWSPWIDLHVEDDIENDGSYDQALFGQVCHEGQVRVEFRDPNSQRMQERIGGTFLMTPVPLRMEPWSIDFGEVPLGSSTEQDVIVTNTGDTPLAFDFVSPCLDFEIVAGGGPVTVPPSGMHTATIRFDPEGLGPSTCEISTGNCNVYVTGVGTDAASVDEAVGGAGSPPRNFLEVYPNPSNPSTTIRFGIDRPAQVTLAIFDVSGRLVRSLVDEPRHARADGWTVEWDGLDSRHNSVPSGIYFCRIRAGAFTTTRALTVLK